MYVCLYVCIVMAVIHLWLQFNAKLNRFIVFKYYVSKTKTLSVGQASIFPVIDNKKFRKTLHTPSRLYHLELVLHVTSFLSLGHIEVYVLGQSLVLLP